MTAASSLRQRILSHDATVGVVGLGYVGLPVAVRFADVGFPVVGFDVSERVVEGIAAGRSHVMDVPDAPRRTSGGWPSATRC